MRQSSTSGNVVLSDVLHDKPFGTLSEKLRLRWWDGVTQRFRHRAETEFGGVFPTVETGAIEHSGCEFIRFCRKLHKLAPHFIRPEIRCIFDAAVSGQQP